MVAIGGLVIFGALLVAIALLFAFVTNHFMPASSARRRAAFASVAAALLVTIPAYVALLGSGADPVAISAIVVATTVMAAVGFPFALMIARKRPRPGSEQTFD